MVLSLCLFVFFVGLSGALLSWLASAQQPLQRSNSGQRRGKSVGIEGHAHTERGTGSSNSAHERAAYDADLIERVNAVLPQTQCAQCGHPGCRPYAEAIIQHNAPINQCPPGGEALIQDLAHLLGKEVIELDRKRGKHKPAQVALIEESACIGCTLCIAACPVDAIVGASKQMHTVIREQCTGCELCLPPCPVDCIELIPLSASIDGWHWPRPV